MQTHVKVLAILFIVGAACLLLFSMMVGMGLSLLGGFIGASGEPDAQTGAMAMGLVGMFAAIFFAVMAVPSLICGIGLLKLRPWARIMGIILCAISLIKLPVGTIFGIYGLWVLLTKDTEALFVKPADAP